MSAEEAQAVTSGGAAASSLNGAAPAGASAPPPSSEPAAAVVTTVPLVLDPGGLAVVSDIDDTVKITEVFRGVNQVLQNTFTRRFRAVPGMPELYRTWATTHRASFDFVSKSPPELHEPIERFLVEAGFPLAALHLCSLWSSDRSGFKERRIAALLAEFPEKRFVLVGDSGERDAQIYAAVARRHPGRVAKVLIRRVSVSHGVDRRTFDGLDPGAWQVFDHPSEIVLNLDKPEAEVGALPAASSSSATTATDEDDEGEAALRAPPSSSSASTSAASASDDGGGRAAPQPAPSTSTPEVPPTKPVSLDGLLLSVPEALASAFFSQARAWTREPEEKEEKEEKEEQEERGH